MSFLFFWTTLKPCGSFFLSRPVRTSSYRTVHSLSLIMDSTLNLAEKNRRFDSLSLHIQRPPLRVVDIGCGTGESTHYLNEFIKYSYSPFPTHLELVGLDTCPKELRQASSMYPFYTFQYYDFLYQSQYDLSPNSLDVIQISTEELQKNVTMYSSRIGRTLKPNGLLHMYGTFSTKFPWKLYGLSCKTRFSFPLDPTSDYVVLQPLHANAWSQGLPVLLLSSDEGGHCSTSA